jgi:hypothetical protein
MHVFWGMLSGNDDALPLNHNKVTLSCRFNSQLVKLDLRMCPMTSAKTYHALAVRRLPYLKQLDGNVITAQDRHLANTRGASISPSVLRAACKFQPFKHAVVPTDAATDAATAAGKAATGSAGCQHNSKTHPTGSTACTAAKQVPALSKQTRLEANDRTNSRPHHCDSISRQHGEPPLSAAVEVVLQVRFKHVEQ